MRVFVESGDSLRGELASKPVGFLDETYAASTRRGSQSRRYTARSPADN
jgi:hypothetical protein